MTITLYCVLATAQTEVPRGLTGIDGAPVRCVGTAAFDAWVSDAPSDPSANIARVRAHDHVVSTALAAGTTPLPARFGQRFESEDALVDHLDEQARTLTADLARLQGLVEMSIIVAPRASAKRAGDHEGARISPDDPEAGHRYLETLRNRALRAGDARKRLITVADAVAAQVTGISRAQAAAEGGKLDAYSVAHLVARSAVPAFTEAAAKVRDPELRIIVAGPRAPYSFTSASEVDRNMPRRAEQK